MGQWTLSKDQLHLLTTDDGNSIDALQKVFSYIGDKEVSVTKPGSVPQYLYGRSGHPEISIQAGKGGQNVTWASEMYSSVFAYDQLKFVSGPFRYVVCDTISIPKTGLWSPEGAGLIVWLGDRKVFDHACTNTALINSRLIAPMGLPEEEEQLFQ